MSAINIGGSLVHYEKLGRGRPVILIHGWIGSWRYWIPLMRQLQLKYAVYAIDLFGYGDSARNPARYTVNEQMQMLAGFMRELAIKKAAFVGHGLGAMVTAEFARNYPERVARMMLISAPVFDVGDLKNRPMSDQGRLMTPSNARNTFPGEAALSPEDYEEKTQLRRPKGLDDARVGSSSAADITVPSASQDTIVNPSNVIDRGALARAAAARGGAILDGDDELGNTNPELRELLQQSGKNPLSRALNADSSTLLARCFKRSDADYEKLQPDVAKMDDRAIAYSSEFFDPGEMLDSLRALSTSCVIVHGEEDPLIPLPSVDVWDFLTLQKDEKVATVQLPGVRHFPMLEYESFPRMVTSFLEASSISNLDMKERWRRRTR
jgi:pimeloyl-ACP methyl ester carboxylesterase